MAGMVTRIFGADGPASPTPDPDLPIGAFRTCPRGQHVIEWWMSTCEACDAPPELAYQAPPASPPPREQPVAVTPPRPPLVPDPGPEGGRHQATRTYRAQPDPVQAPPPVLPSAPPAFQALPRLPKPSTETLMMPTTRPEQAAAWGTLVVRYEIPLESSNLRIGSDGEAEIVINAPGVDARHARLRRDEENRVWISVLGGNDMRVNGRPETEIGLAPEDQIRIGSVTLVIRPPGAR